jgi:predicted dehydrogenase
MQFDPVRIAVVGCGYVATSYAETLIHHPELKLVAVCDCVRQRAQVFANRWPADVYDDVVSLLAKSDAELILNLTNPRDHLQVSKSCLEAGRHVYSEKPLAMSAEDAKALTDLASSRNLQLMTAPCSALSETATTLYDVVNQGLVGKVRLVIANFDDGMIAPREKPWNWRNSLGSPWPAKDEFEVGCTYEHAGYVLTWLARMFGSATSVTSFASCQIPDKGIHTEGLAPDFTVGCIEYPHGVVARVTCSLVAPFDKSITIIGDDGILRVANVRHERCPIYLRRYERGRLQAAIENRINKLWMATGRPPLNSGWLGWRRVPYTQQPPSWLKSGHKLVDFLRGPADMARTIRSGQSPSLPPGLGWHITEIIEALQHPSAGSNHTKIHSSLMSPDLPKLGLRPPCNE